LRLSGTGHDSKRYRERELVMSHHFLFSAGDRSV
jgi:hypothetical protein